MGVIIRAATSDDDAQIWSMLEPVFRAGQTYAIDPSISKDAALAYWLRDHAYICASDHPLGTYYIQDNRPGGGGHYCNCGFVTAPSARGQGVATAMLSHALGEAKRLGYLGMVFNFVVASNIQAIALWERYGFETVGRVPGAFIPLGGVPTDSLVMFRRL